jgi:hypothetical protein
MKNTLLIFLVTLVTFKLNAQWTNISFAGNDFFVIVAKGDTLFAGGAAGIYKSINGNGYTDISTGLPQWPWIQDIVIYNNKIFVSVIYDGVFVSEDNGATWKTFNNQLNYNNGVFKMCASNGYLFVASASRMYRTPINQANWTKVLEVNGGVTEIVANGQNIFAATTAEGVHFSTDSGNNWLQKSTGIPPIGSFFHEIRTIGVNTNNDVFIGVRGYGVYKYFSTENKWKQSSVGIKEVDDGVDTYYYGLKAIENTVIVGNSGKVYLSTNNGNTFSNISDNTYLYTQNLFMNKDYIYYAGAGIRRKRNNGLYTLTAIKDVNTRVSNNIYPNPFTDFINIDNITGKVLLSLFTISGELIKKTEITSEKPYLDTQNIQNGLYILKIEQEGKMAFYKKLIK